MAKKQYNHGYISLIDLEAEGLVNRVGNVIKTDQKLWDPNFRRELERKYGLDQIPNPSGQRMVAVAGGIPEYLSQNQLELRILRPESATRVPTVYSQAGNSDGSSDELVRGHASGDHAGATPRQLQGMAGRIASEREQKERYVTDWDRLKESAASTYVHKSDRSRPADRGEIVKLLAKHGFNQDDPIPLTPGIRQAFYKDMKAAGYTLHAEETAAFSPEEVQAGMAEAAAEEGGLEGSVEGVASEEPVGVGAPDEHDPRTGKRNGGGGNGGGQGEGNGEQKKPSRWKDYLRLGAAAGLAAAIAWGATALYNKNTIDGKINDARTQIADEYKGELDAAKKAREAAERGLAERNTDYKNLGEKLDKFGQTLEGVKTQLAEESKARGALEARLAEEQKAREAAEKKASDEAKRLAEAEAKRKAAEEEKRKAEEAKRLAEEEAKRLAEARKQGPSQPPKLVTIDDVPGLIKYYEDVVWDFKGVDTTALAHISHMADVYRGTGETKEERRQARGIAGALDWYVAQRLAEMSRNPDLNAAHQLAYLKLAKRVDYHDKEIDAEYDERAGDLARAVRRENLGAEYDRIWVENLDKYHLRDENNRFRWRWLPWVGEVATPFYMPKHIRDAVVHRDAWGVKLNDESNPSLEEARNAHNQRMEQIISQSGLTNTEAVRQSYRNQVNGLRNFSLEQTQATNVAIDRDKELKRQIDEPHQRLLAFRHHKLAQEAEKKKDAHAQNAHLFAAQMLVGQNSRDRNNSLFLMYRQDRAPVREQKERLDDIVAAQYPDEVVEARWQHARDIGNILFDAAKCWFWYNVATGGFSGGDGGNGGGSHGGGNGDGGHGGGAGVAGHGGGANHGM